MKTNYLHRYTLVLCMLFACHKGSAQCAAPTAATATPTASDCINNGRITVTDVTGGATVDRDTTLEYAILGYSGDGPTIAPIYQSSNEFTDLFPGSYIIGVRHNCQGMYSPEYTTSAVTVAGTYTPISATLVMDYPQSNCRYGQVSVTASSGYTGISGQYQYQQVNNITSSAYDTAGVRQSSNVFHFIAGTYYIRIYDDCGSYITRAVTVTGTDVATNPYAGTPYNRKRFVRTDCGEYSYQFFKPGGLNFTANNLVLGGKKLKTYLYDPTNLAIDSSSSKTTGTVGHDISSYIVAAYRRTVGSLKVYGPFYEKVVDSCGTVFYSDSLYIDTTMNLTATLTRSGSRCDTGDYTLTVREAGSAYSGVAIGSAYRVRVSNIGSPALEYTNDSGKTWTIDPLSAGMVTDSVLDGKFGIRICDSIAWATPPATVPFVAALNEANSWACNGNSGIYMNTNDSFGTGTWDSTTIQFTSAPAAYTTPLTMVFNNKGKNATDATDLTNYFFNLPLGTYDYKLTNECGQTTTGSVVLDTPRVLSVAITAASSCATGRVEIQPVINTAQMGSSAINTSGGTSRVRYSIMHSATGTYLNSNGAAGNTGSIPVNTANRSISVAPLNSTDTGWYVFTVWADSAFLHTHTFCAVQDSVHVSDTGSSLKIVSTFYACRTSGGGTISASSTGGIAPVKYELLDLTSGTAYGPQATGDFSGLTVSHTYRITATDTCGNTSVNTNTFDTVSTQVLQVGTGCLGTDVTLYAADVSGGTYRWMLGADTLSYDRSLTLTNLADSNEGMYTLIIRTACTEASIDSYKLVVNPIPAAPVPAKDTVVYCQNVTSVRLAATGSKLKWYTDSTGGTGVSSGPKPPTSVSDSFYYYVSQTSGKGCESRRAPVLVQVNPLPADTPLTGGYLTYCSGVTADVLAATGDSLMWFTDATGGTGDVNAPTPSTASAGTTSYYVAQTSEAGCSGPRAEIQVTVNATPAAPGVTSPVSYCKDAATTALTATGSNLKWYVDATGGTGDATAPTPSSAVVKDTTWYVSRTSAKNCEGPRAAITVKVNPLPAEPVVTSPVNFCDGSTSAALTATGTTLLWYSAASGGSGSSAAPVPSTSGTDTISYFVSQTSALSCEGPRAEVVVHVNPLPTVTIDPKTRPSFIFCTGVGMTISANSPTGTGYQWSLEGTEISGATGDTLNLMTEGNYTVVVTNVYGCKTEATQFVQQDPTPPSVLTPTDITKCEGADVTLICHPGITGYVFDWRKDGLSMTPATPTSNSKAVSETGVYTVIVTNTLGCQMVTNSATVSDYPAVIKPTIVRADPLLSLDHTYPTYQWFFNGVAISGASGPTYTMTADGEYYAYVSDRNGCHTYSDTIVVKGLSIEYPGSSVQSLRIFPNPTSGKVFIEASAPVNVMVTDATGKTILRQDEAKEINLEPLADGMYFLHIFDQKGLPVRIEKVNKVSGR